MKQNYLKQNPEVTDINASRSQRDLDSKTKNEIDQFFKDNLDQILDIKKKIYEQ